MTPAEIQQSNEDAQAMNAFNARTQRAVEGLLACFARWALAVAAGSVLGVHLINVMAEALP